MSLTSALPLRLDTSDDLVSRELLHARQALPVEWHAAREIGPEELEKRALPAVVSASLPYIYLYNNYFPTQPVAAKILTSRPVRRIIGNCIRRIGRWLKW